MLNILMTGSSGYIGLYLKRKLEQEGYGCVEFEGRIEDVEAYKKYDNLEILRFIHLAARADNNSGVTKDVYDVNLIGTLNVLEFCRVKSIPLTYPSTAYVYKESQSALLEENDRKPKSPYAMSKYLSEELCRFYHERYGLKICILRLFNVYGLKQPHNTVIPTVILGLLHEDTLQINSLHPRRDFVFIEDVVDAFFKSISFNGYGIFNIGSGSAYSIQQIVDKVKKELLVNKPVVAKHIEIDTNDTIFSNSAKALETLNWKAVTSIDEGLKKTVFELKHQLKALF